MAERGPDGEAERMEGEVARVLICEGRTSEASGFESADFRRKRSARRGCTGRGRPTHVVEVDGYAESD